MNRILSYHIFLIKNKNIKISVNLIFNKLNKRISKENKKKFFISKNRIVIKVIEKIFYTIKRVYIFKLNF